MDNNIEKKEILNNINEKYKILLRILEAEGNSEVRFAINQLKNDLSAIEDLFENGTLDTDYNDILHLIKSNYRRMYPPRGGLTEFLIWRQDFNERVSVNKPLIDVQDELAAIFKKLT